MRPITHRERVRRWTPVCAAALLVAAAVAIPSGPASAHAYLESSIPAEGAHLSAIPDQVSLIFGDNIEAQFTTVTLAVGTSAPATLATATSGQTVTVELPANILAWQAPASTAPWTVNYRAVANDGHPVEGTISFTVTASPPQAAAPLPSADPATPSPPPIASAAGGQRGPARSKEPVPWVAMEILSAGTVALTAVIWLLARRARRAEGV